MVICRLAKGYSHNVLLCAYPLCTVSNNSKTLQVCASFKMYVCEAHHSKEMIKTYVKYIHHVDIRPHCDPYTSHDSTGRDLAPPYTIY